jgi:hypothetical protein
MTPGKELSLPTGNCSLDLAAVACQGGLKGAIAQ